MSILSELIWKGSKSGEYAYWIYNALFVTIERVFVPWRAIGCTNNIVIDSIYLCYLLKGRKYFSNLTLICHTSEKNLRPGHSNSRSPAPSLANKILYRDNVSELWSIVQLNLSVFSSNRSTDFIVGILLKAYLKNTFII